MTNRRGNNQEAKYQNPAGVVATDTGSPKKHRYSAGSVSTGHRSSAELWAMFKVLAASEGITGNVALNRAMAYCVQRGWLPPHIAKPQLPLEMVPREQEPPVLHS